MEKEKRAQQANVFMQGWRPPRLASWGTPGDPWAREAGLQIPLRRSPPLCQGLPVTPAHRQQHSPKNAHVYQRARAHTHTHTHTHSTGSRACMQTELQRTLHPLSARFNHQAEQYTGSPSAGLPQIHPPPTTRSPTSGPEPRSWQLAPQSRRTNGARAACKPGKQPCPADARRWGWQGCLAA